MSIEDIVAQGDKVAARFVEHGTHNGEFMGIAPTGRQATWTEIGILRIEGGKIVESWYETDMLGLMQQIGALPAPSQAP
jgi:predicted ester cyclase